MPMNFLNEFYFFVSNVFTLACNTLFFHISNLFSCLQMMFSLPTAALCKRLNQLFLLQINHVLNDVKNKEENYLEQNQKQRINFFRSSIVNEDFSRKSEKFFFDFFFLTLWQSSNLTLDQIVLWSLSADSIVLGVGS